MARSNRPTSFDIAFRGVSQPTVSRRCADRAISAATRRASPSRAS
jgi:hypothetical protein